MMNAVPYLRLFFAFVLFVFLFQSCSKNEKEEPGPEPEGILKIEFKMEKPIDSLVYPTYQTTVYLIDKSTDSLNTLFVSEWLAYGGYRHEGVCPRWSAFAASTSFTEDEVDAFTGATPYLGPFELSIDCNEKNVSDGEYEVVIETHVTESENITYKCQIEIGKINQSEGELQANASTSKTELQNVLSNVIVKFY